MNKQTIDKLRKMGRSIKILYVEDDEVIAQQLEILLKKIFANIDLARDGVEGLELYKSSRYDIVITDIEMPNMSGIELIKEIKKLNEDQVVVVTSAYNDSKYLMELIDNGVEKFLNKPIDINKFIVTISKLVVGIYNAKKKDQLQKQLDERLKLNQLLLDRMITPIVIVSGNDIEYINKKFEESFESCECDIETQHCSIGNIFKDKKLSSMGNQELISYLEKENSSKRVVKTHSDYERFRVNVTSIEKTDKRLVCFFNEESVNIELDKLKNKIQRDSLTSLLTRDIFLHDMEVVFENDIEYDMIGFGLKNIKEYIRLFGVNSLRDVFSKLGLNLTSYFNDELLNGDIKLYYFDTNHFVALVQRADVARMKKLIKEFGTKVTYTNKRAKVYEPMYLDVLSIELNNRQSANKNMSEVEALLYLLKQQL